MVLGQFVFCNTLFDKLFPGIVGSKTCGLAASIIFKIPVVRENFFHWGYIDASRKIASKAIENGQNLVIVVGGEEESLNTCRGIDMVILNKRKGFIRLALSYGITLVPLYCLGGVDTYQTYGWFIKQRRWIQKHLGMALPIFHGRWYITPIPYPTPLTILVGKPIPTPISTNYGAKPDEDLVDEYHQLYINSLIALYSKHAPKGRKLIVR